MELGHAERRRPPTNEDDAMIAKKAQAAVRNGLVPLVCIGEKGKIDARAQTAVRPEISYRTSITQGPIAMIS